MTKVFLVIIFDDKNEDGHTLSVHSTLKSAEKEVGTLINDPSEKWKKEKNFKKGEDPTGHALKRWHETTQDYFLQINQRWVETK
jgi:hypothetical protein